LSRIAVVEPLTLLGKEVRGRLADVLGAGHDVRLLTTDPEQGGTLTEVGGAAAVVTAPGELVDDVLDGVELAIFCGTPEQARPLLRSLRAATAVGFGGEGAAVVAGVNDDAAVAGRLLSPPAAVVGLAHLGAALRSLGLEELTATAIVAASDHGDAGLQELYEQTRSIVAFTAQPPSPIFGRQLAFNLLPTEDGGAAAEGALREVLGVRPAVRLQTLHGGVFHGVSLSVGLRFAADPGEEAIREALAEHPPIEWFEDPAALGPIDAAQSDSLLAGGLRRAGADATSYWLWATLDNLTVGGALNALRIARVVLGA
jgi:aspartate-semialdehyde dehydrogenase